MTYGSEIAVNGRAVASEALQGSSPLDRLMGDGSRPIKVVAWPGRPEHSVGIWNLFDHETRMARIDAIKYLNDVCKLSDTHLLTDTSLAQEETQTQLLFRALRDPAEPLRPFASSVNKLRISLTPDDRQCLFDIYLEFVDERSPLRKIRTSEEVDELVTALSKGWTSEITLSSYDSATLKSITRELAARLAKLTKPLYSDTSSPTGSSSESGPPESDR